MRRAARWLGWAALGLVATVLLLGAGVAGLIWWALPASTESAKLPGLGAPVAITLDKDGIPWIKARSEADAAEALGFLHARDRMFQMELMRRVASGRLSEIVGEPALRTDRTLRILGLRRRAEAELPGLPADTRALLEAYARGVNGWIAAHGRFSAPEFIPLGTPEPWTAVDSLLWGKTMALYLAGNWRADLNRASAAAKLSPAAQKALWPDRAAIPRPDAALDGGTSLGRYVPRYPEPFTLPEEASNEWAVDAAHSQTGGSLLAGDPHLALTFPSFWYLARIDTPEGTLAGATAPGVPFLVLGRNARIAWTFTTTGADTQDVFVETVLPDGQYATPDGPCPFVTRQERIKVRGQDDVLLTVRETRHGPVLSDADPAAANGPVLSVAMAALEAPDTAAAGLLALNRAQDLDGAQTASAEISAPVQNLLVAEHSRIGMFTTGRVPLRKSGDGSLPVSGANGEHDWTGFAGGTQLPHILAPESGRLVNANEPVVGRDYPVNMGVDGFGDWRARRIRALLDRTGMHAPAEFASMQRDVGSAFAEAVLPAMLATQPQDDTERTALARLGAWDRTMRRDAPEPLLFNAWVRRFVADSLAGLGVSLGEIGSPAIDVAGQALGPGGSALCGGDCPAMLQRSLGEAVRELGPDWTSRRWGEVHVAAFRHPLLGLLPVVGDWLAPSIAQPGDDSTIFRGSPLPGGWMSGHGPEFRGVYDLAHPDESLFALAPGESGDPFSGLSGATLERWRDGPGILLGPAPLSLSGRITLEPLTGAIGR